MSYSISLVPVYRRRGTFIYPGEIDGWLAEVWENTSQESKVVAVTGPFETDREAGTAAVALCRMRFGVEPLSGPIYSGQIRQGGG